MTQYWGHRGHAAYALVYEHERGHEHSQRESEWMCELNCCVWRSVCADPCVLVVRARVAVVRGART